MVAQQKQDAATIKPLPIFCYYDVQRFTQFGSMDCANWYGIQVDSGKKKQALLAQWQEATGLGPV